ncbi:hypothetical protein V6259_13035 [Marinomonas sp. TI.3.20]|uniref:hypothetical protein n=1 Tax=Marinomonas sp. TI.3.20 TaxID=3121296 RepID=UPI00311FE22F
MLKNIRLVTICCLILTGCSHKPSPMVAYWHFGNTEGWYPLLKINNNPVYIEGNQVFMNSTSMLVNCEGSPIKLGKYFLFLGKNTYTYLYEKHDNGTGRIVEHVKPNYLLEDKKGKVWDKDSLELDFSLRGSGKDLRSQCTDVSILARRVNVAKPLNE